MKTFFVIMSSSTSLYESSSECLGNNQIFVVYVSVFPKTGPNSHNVTLWRKGIKYILKKDRRDLTLTTKERFVLSTCNNILTMYSLCFYMILAVKFSILFLWYYVLSINAAYYYTPL